MRIKNKVIFKYGNGRVFDSGQGSFVAEYRTSKLDGPVQRSRIRFKSLQCAEKHILENAISPDAVKTMEKCSVEELEPERVKHCRRIAPIKVQDSIR
ncbi:MAG: hypothetical protein ACR2PH_12815, partial [Desulfobulbia bacterium]